MASDFTFPSAASLARPHPHTHTHPHGPDASGPSLPRARARRPSLVVLVRMSGPPSSRISHDSHQRERHAAAFDGLSSSSSTSSSTVAGSSSSNSSSSLATPMAIPRAQQAVPPPLPPPSHIPDIARGHDPGWQWGNDPSRPDFGRSAAVKPGSSLLGGSPFRRFGRQEEQEREHFFHRHHRSPGTADARRGSSISTITADRDHDMLDANVALHAGDEDVLMGDGPPQRPNYRYVSLTAFPVFSF